MDRKSEHPQPSLFDDEKPLVKLRPACRVELVSVVEALLREIAATMANVKSGKSIDEQDHR
jgi:hypothetical protein